VIQLLKKLRVSKSPLAHSKADGLFGKIRIERQKHGFRVFDGLIGWSWCRPNNGVNVAVSQFLIGLSLIIKES